MDTRCCICLVDPRALLQIAGISANQIWLMFHRTRRAVSPLASAKGSTSYCRQPPRLALKLRRACRLSIDGSFGCLHHAGGARPRRASVAAPPHHRCDGLPPLGPSIYAFGACPFYEGVRKSSRNLITESIDPGWRRRLEFPRWAESLRRCSNGARYSNRKAALAQKARHVDVHRSLQQNFFWTPARRIWIDKGAMNTGP